jgi:prepilin peptidase CpaA
MVLSTGAALWFLPFVLPICLYVAFTDMSRMKIPNHAVIALVAVYAVVGLIALPFADYLWRYLALLIVLVAGIALNAGGLVGAGDAKFAAAAALFIPAGDLRMIMVIFSATLIAAFLAHRLARVTPLRRLAPGWESWDRGKDFPMGLALGGALAFYLILGLVAGS